MKVEALDVGLVVHLVGTVWSCVGCDGLPTSAYSFLVWMCSHHVGGDILCKKCGKNCSAPNNGWDENATNVHCGGTVLTQVLPRSVGSCFCNGVGVGHCWTPLASLRNQALPRESAHRLGASGFCWRSVCRGERTFTEGATCELEIHNSLSISLALHDWHKERLDSFFAAVMTVDEHSSDWEPDDGGRQVPVAGVVATRSSAHRTSILMEERKMRAPP